MYIKREQYLSKIRRYYDSNLIKVLTGIRRCGKSVILEQIKEEVVNNGLATKDHVISMNFEDLQFNKYNTAEKLNRAILKEINDEKKYFIFLDEIQHVRSFERVLASLKATQNVSIFVTGSNSKLLSGRLASLLVGRCKDFKIMPFSYSEYLKYFEESGKNLPQKPLQDFLRFGGMPQRLDYSNEEDIKEYLSSLYYGIIEKDICHSKSKIDKETFLTVSRYIIANASKKFSCESVVEYYNANNTDTIYRNTISRYLEKMEMSCLISRVSRYDVATKRTLKQSEKQYAVDTGLILTCSNSNRLFPANALENVVYNELIFRGYDVRIGKTYKGEIDFVAMKDGKKCFIQVAYLLSDEDVVAREFGAFASVRDPSPKYVMSLDEIDMSSSGIAHLNIEDWLTGKRDIVLI